MESNPSFERSNPPALAYAAAGIPVFPCNPTTKRPLSKNGFYDATTDPAKVGEYWTKFPTAMIGMPTGAASKISVVDLDRKDGNDGFLYMPNWQARSTAAVVTPSNGAHVYFGDFAGRAKCSVGTIAPGVDVRGEGGYVILPPSRRSDGEEYKFAVGGIEALTDLPPFPEELLEAERRSSDEVPPRGELRAELRIVEAAVKVIPADDGYESWNRVGMAIYCATGGSDDGFRIFDEHSQKAGDRYDPEGVEAKWDAYSRGQGPNRIGAGTLCYLADQTGLDWRTDPTLPVIVVAKGDYARIVDAAEAELIASGAAIFERGGSLVQPIKTEVAASDDRKTDAILLKRMVTANITYALNKHVVFKRYDVRKGKLVVTDPPTEIGIGVLHKGEWQFPHVAGVTTSPTIRSDGTILDQPGHDGATDLYYSPDGHMAMPPIKANPTEVDAKRALELFKDLLREFPFVAPIDLAVALSAVVTPILRGAFDVAPMFLIHAHMAGSGKSYLADIASTIITGRPCPVITNVGPEEMEKRLGALVLDGAALISLDNCSSDLKGDLLCQVVERPSIRVRILGKSQAPECEWRGTMFANGNNIRAVGDMVRRTLHCHLDPNVERPERRRFEADPVRKVMRNRGEYVAAAITISRAWRVAGEPGGVKPIASYGKWSKAVRAPLVWLGLPDPVDSMEAAREEDPERAAMGALIDAWREELTVGVPYGVGDLIKETMEHPDQHPALHTVLMAEAGTPRGDSISSQKLAALLQRTLGQISGEHRIDEVTAVRTGKRYVLRHYLRES